MSLFEKFQDKKTTKMQGNKPNAVIYDKPKILAVDFNIEVTEKLKQDGFNIEVGTFGQNYSVHEGDECGFNGSLPYLLEKDIILVNLKRDEQIVALNPCDSVSLQKANRVTYISEQGQNYFNPAYLYSWMFLGEFEKVVNKGGIIIVFSNYPEEETYKLVTIERNREMTSKRLPIDNYNWLPTRFRKEGSILGREFYVENDYKGFVETITQGCNELEYRCIFPNITSDEDDAVLMRNNVNEPIGFVRLEKNDDNIGYYFILPQFENKYRLISNLFKEVLPDLKPELFPSFVKNSWLDNEEYIFPKIKEKITQKKEIIEEYQSKLEIAEQEIGDSREEYSFMTNILISQGYDEFLVDNVRQVLKFIGYEKVIDVDDIVEGNKQEDLRIIDNGEFIVIEIKGHNGNPTEDDCQALLKYINRNMKKEKRTDIHGILIENHQKQIAPMLRSNPAYTKEQIDDALRDGYTLVDTWQLFQAARLLQEGLLSFGEIDTDLNKPGLFSAIPSTWTSLGKIDNYYNQVQVVGMILETNEIKPNEEIIIQNGNDYFKQKISSIRINDIEVDHAKKGDAISFKIERPISKQAKIYHIT